jgi:hypothetical protein
MTEWSARRALALGLDDQDRSLQTDSDDENQDPDATCDPEEDDDVKELAESATLPRTIAGHDPSRDIAERGLAEEEEVIVLGPRPVASDAKAAPTVSTHKEPITEQGAPTGTRAFSLGGAGCARPFPSWRTSLLEVRPQEKSMSKTDLEVATGTKGTPGPVPPIYPAGAPIPPPLRLTIPACSPNIQCALPLRSRFEPTQNQKFDPVRMPIEEARDDWAGLLVPITEASSKAT